MNTKILLSGAKGRMGKAISAIAHEHDCSIVSQVDVDDDPSKNIKECEVLIDFSCCSATMELAKLAATHEIPMIIGTTGHPMDEKKEILNVVSNLPVVWAGNFSTGVNLLFYLTQEISRILDSESDFDPEVIEMHHRLKQDAPSGTAERLLEIIKESRKVSENDIMHGRRGLVGKRQKQEIGSHSIRGGDIVGEHTVIYAGIGERVELTHRATDRSIFACGALKAAKWVIGQTPGLYSMQEVLGLSSPRFPSPK